MNGTLAIWYEPEENGHSSQPIDVKPQHPNLEMHFNLWRDNPSKTNFLDIGLRLSDIGYRNGQADLPVFSGSASTPSVSGSERCDGLWADAGRGLQHGRRGRE